ncbi:MAG: replication-relaxation family protein [Clostridia bacterium]|nr:replication-relaxation family protein [Clostridia bacterium]
MINDTEVKTKVSPFAVRENEIKVFDGKEGFASINQVVFKMDQGYINESHIKALEVVNEYGFVTSRQVTQVLESRGKLDDLEKEKRQDKVAKWLEDLTKSKVLSRYAFETASGRSSYRVYALEKIATYILKQRNIVTNWQPTDNTKPAYALKRKLAGNQVVIAYMTKVGAFKEADPNLLLFSKRYNVKFKPTGGTVRLEAGGNEVNFVFEVVRRNEDWQNMLAEKLQLYADFYENFAKNDAGFYEVPQIVFVGEDVNHNAEIFRIAKKIGFNIKDEDMYFTTDLQQLEETLEKSISVFEFDSENNKYKLTVKSLDILKPGDASEMVATKLKSKTYSPNVIVE